MKETLDFYNTLVFTLEPLYHLPHVLGGHDMLHVKRMEKLGERILPNMPTVDPAEYKVTVWLHNLDRCVALKEDIVKRGGIQVFMRLLLQNSPFGEEQKERIIDAVSRHNKRDDDLTNDSPLLIALRIADKLDRFTPLNIMSGSAHRSNIPHFDFGMPFDYRNNKPCHLKYYLWNVEWYGMFPYDWARNLVDKEFFAGFLSFIRQTGRDISERLEIPNEIEKELRLALGRYYDEWSVSK